MPESLVVSLLKLASCLGSGFAAVGSRVERSPGDLRVLERRLSLRSRFRFSMNIWGKL